MSAGLEKAKEVIKENYEDGKYGLYNTRNIVGDIMCPLYRRKH